MTLCSIMTQPTTPTKRQFDGMPMPLSLTERSWLSPVTVISTLSLEYLIALSIRLFALLNYDTTNDPDKKTKYLTIANKQLRRLGELVENILAMSMERRKTMKLTVRNRYQNARENATIRRNTVIMIPNICESIWRVSGVIYAL